MHAYLVMFFSGVVYQKVMRYVNDSDIFQKQAQVKTLNENKSKRVLRWR